MVPIFTSRSLAVTSHHLAAAAPCGPGQVSRDCADRCEGEGAARSALGGAPSTGRNWPGCCGSPGKAFRRADLTLLGPGCRKSLPNTFLLKASLKAKFTARTCWKSHESGWLSLAGWPLLGRLLAAAVQARNSV